MDRRANLMTKMIQMNDPGAVIKKRASSKTNDQKKPILPPHLNERGRDTVPPSFRHRLIDCPGEIASPDIRSSRQFMNHTVSWSSPSPDS
jgi:hypothetical protein